MMKKSGFTVAVVDADGNARSDVWKFKAAKSGHLMVGNGSMADFKYTIHAPLDGKLGCHIAWAEGRQPADFPEGSRALHRWERSETGLGKANAVLSVNFPTSFLAAPYNPERAIDIALPVPADGMVAEFIVIYSREPLALENWPEDAVMRGNHKLASDEFVHFISWQRGFPDDYALDRVEGLYPEKNLAAFPPKVSARLTLHLEPDENGCVKAIEVGGQHLRDRLAARWGLPS